MNPRGRLFRKYVIIFAGLVSGALLASGLIEISFYYQDHQQAQAALQREKALAAAAKIEQFIKDIERQVGWVSQPRVGASETLEQRRLDYLQLLRQLPAVTTISLLNGAGREQLRVSRLAIDRIRSDADLSQDPLFVGARPGKTYFGPVYFRQESEPYMTIAVVGKGEEAGLTAAEVNLKFIWHVVSQIKVGQAGHAYVVDAGGYLIAHPDIKLVLQKTHLSSAAHVQAARSGPPQPGTTEEKATIARDLAGRQVLTAVAAIRPPGWFVFVDLPLGEAFAPLYASIYRTVGLVLVGIGLSVLASLFLARRMVAPIRAIQAGAARIGAGALDQRIEVRTGDELEGLADQFNGMAAQLRESYSGLERKVEEQTRELRVALQELKDKSQQLEVANRHKSAFLANMSHELRTPLNAIIGFSEILLDPSLKVTEEERTQFLTDVFNGGKHLLKLINEVLDLARIEAGRMELQIEPALLDDLLVVVQSTMRPLAARKGIDLRVDSDRLIPAFPMDAGRVKQILLNLVGNAIKFTPEAGRVWVRANVENGVARVEVGDTGPGIPAEDQERIFLEFQQVKTVGRVDKPEGTGLGLALARRFVDLHGGKLWLESEMGRGSRFFFTLPMALG